MTDLRKTSGCVICIDLKSFYASVECADRGLDPFTTNLVVADPDRSANTICLAITPAMKAAGVRNRCRVRDIPPGIEYLTAIPRMKRYMQVSGEIVGYLRACQPTGPAGVFHRRVLHRCRALPAPLPHRRAHVRKTPDAARLRGFGCHRHGRHRTEHVPSEGGAQHCAKHAGDGIGQLDDESFKREIWFHRPITDIWGIGPGIARRLAKHGAYDLAGVCAVNPKVLRREFGKNAEYLIDHAWGLEACTVEQARGYRPRGHSLTNGQVLMRDYSCREVETLLREMVLGSALELVEKGLCAQVASVYVGYSASNFPHQSWEKCGPFGAAAAGAGGSAKLPKPTNAVDALTDAVLGIYRARVTPELSIRRVNIALADLMPVDKVQSTLFDDAANERKQAARRGPWWMCASASARTRC